MRKYAEMRTFNLQEETHGSALEGLGFLTSYTSKGLTYYADMVRFVLLYKYGGCWFDLDVFFLRSFHPLFAEFEEEIMLYQWENQNYPNNAIMVSLMPEDPKMYYNIKFIAERNLGFGFQQAALTYDLPLHFLILPCSWFDAAWLEDPPGFRFFEASAETYDFSTYFPGAFCFHWHNGWDLPIDDASVFSQLTRLLHRCLLRTSQIFPWIRSRARS